ncbi:uncharacterized protein J8A68_003469 [[Candida] subhashii]|uniref:Uncharacterized protein n=1 Tax=[Candida] subhashii TaxID=561895 RepID=A0A8J5QM50_9ASCO|nr:uncharacterized protein J8A68_003469 [[Candida] subhashii]KAG7663000.1 hypothetical protein J8A68_003469 [[Candida] subhashii]
MNRTLRENTSINSQSSNSNTSTMSGNSPFMNSKTTNLSNGSNTSSITSPESNDISFSSINSTTSSGSKLKTPLKKEELEKIARQLKKKLSKASITAKQALSPTNVRRPSIPKSSPLKGYLMKNNINKTGDYSPNQHMSSSPSTNLYSPNGKSPTHIRTPAAMYLASSPLKNTMTNDSDDSHLDSPTKKRRSSPGKRMILEEISPSRTHQQHSLKPSIDLTDNNNNNNTINNTKIPIDRQTTPTSPPKKDPNFSSNQIMKTPTQPRSSHNHNHQHQQPQPFNTDTEGADLLMYLATSPSPAKPYYSNHTPRAIKQQPPPTQPTFLAPHPPPPVTPKQRAGGINGTLANTRTPQNRLTPFLNNLNAGGTGLPSSGLTLTPTGFNMNDYVNFFTPSPGGTASINARNLLKTPDFNSLMNGNNTPRGGSSKVDGKMLNFNKVLFNHHGDGGQKE